MFLDFLIVFRIRMRRAAEDDGRKRQPPAIGRSVPRRHPAFFESALQYVSQEKINVKEWLAISEEVLRSLLDAPL
jgi:hypothetical protein